MEYFLIFLPLLGAIISGFFGRYIGDRNSEIITSLFVTFSAIISIIIFYEVIINSYENNLIISKWISSGFLDVNWSIKIDPLSSVMLVIVCMISSLVHIYSIGYMSHDPHKTRFMSYLSLFTFAMLMLVTSDNFLQLFFGWEGVGLCSYFLIGFWFKKESANKAAIKAFIVNQYQENITIATWINSGTLNVNWSMKIDSLSAVMLVVVTLVSSLVHIYSIGYMSHDPHKPRFMAYLSLFTFAMLMLVTSDNFIQLFFGWEGVGLCSYFLIGFWFKKDAANAAAIKAFIVNRVGDFGFALGIFLIFYLFEVLFEKLHHN